MSVTQGRNSDTTLRNDDPGAKVGAILANQDRVIDALKALCVKIDADGGIGGHTNYAATISDALTKLSLIG